MMLHTAIILNKYSAAEEKDKMKNRLRSPIKRNNMTTIEPIFRYILVRFGRENTNDIGVIQWNCQVVRSKKGELLTLIHES